MVTAFERGTATSTADLTKKLFTFISTSVPGWQLWSNLDGYVTDTTKGYDMVYRSTGSTGRNEIFIRPRIAPIEPFLKGADYYDYSTGGTGDTGYMTFESYVNFPFGGDGYSGSSDIGKFGPRFMIMTGASSLAVWKTDILSQEIGGSSDIAGTTTAASSTISLDPHGEERLRHARMTVGPAQNFGITFTPHTTDGKKDIFIGSNNLTGLRRYSMARAGGFYSGSTISTTTTLATPSYVVLNLVYAEDRSTKIPYLYLSGSETSGSQKFNLITNTLSSVTAPSWPSRSGNTTTQNSSGVCWDGGNFIYRLRGFAAANTSDWGVYSIATNTWRTTTVPFDPAFQDLPFTPDTQTEIAFLNKAISGLQFNRLYIYDEPLAEIYYMEVDDNGVPHTGSPSWVSQGELDQQMISAQFDFFRSGRAIIGLNAYVGKVNNNNETFKETPRRKVLYVENLKTSGNWAPRTAGSTYIPQGSGGKRGGMINYFDGYMARVRVSINDDTEYVFVGDEDRIIVATKSRQATIVTSGDTPVWNFTYAGAFDSSYSSTPYGELVESVNAGISKTIRLTNVEGTFQPHTKYTIINTTESGSFTRKHKFEGTNRTVSASEIITITSVSGNTVTASLKHTYPAGSKIAIDPQPVGLMFGELEKFQTTNIATRLEDDLSGSDGSSSQMYAISKPEDTINNSSVVQTTLGQGTPLWPLSLSNVEGEGVYNSREVRGTLKGVFAVGNTVEVGENTTIAVGGRSYFVINPDRYQSLIAIGPIREE